MLKIIIILPGFALVYVPVKVLWISHGRKWVASFPLAQILIWDYVGLLRYWSFDRFMTIRVLVHMNGELLMESDKGQPSRF